MCAGAGAGSSAAINDVAGPPIICEQAADFAPALHFRAKNSHVQNSHALGVSFADRRGRRRHAAMNGYGLLVAIAGPRAKSSVCNEGHVAERGA